MANLFVQNLGWETDRAKAVSERLIPFFESVDAELKFKHPVAVHLMGRKDPKGLERSQYDEGTIILYEDTPDYRGDFLHELAHQIVRWKDVPPGLRRKVDRIGEELERDGGDGRIFLQPHTWSRPQEIFATIFKWWVLGKVADPGYREVLDGYQPGAAALVEKILEKTDLQKSAPVAQPVEQLICNQQVGGSRPSRGSEAQS